MNKATKVTEEQMEDKVLGEKYWEVEETRVTVCVIILKNGYSIVGSSACVNQDDYDVSLGRKYARRDAMDKLWSLEGYSRKEDEYNG